MKRTVLLLAFIVFFSVSSAFAQTPSAPNAPFRSLEMWFATQSAPEMRDKAQWGLDDVNSYRRMMGLTELPDAIIDANSIVVRADARERRLFRRPLLRR